MSRGVNLRDVAGAGAIANRMRPGHWAAAPHKQAVESTGDASVDTVLDVVNTTAAPFMQAPPPEQGAAGWVAQGLGGALGVVGAPQMLIDTAAAVYLPKVPVLGPVLKKLSFPRPAATVLTSFHVGFAHAHAHPPSMGVPLISMGPILGAGAVNVMVGGLPAARAGDIGLSVTCGTLAPPLEICTGSSNVFLGGARAARMGDITRHCNPATLGPFGLAMSAVGLAAGAAGAVAASNAFAAGQAAADASVLAIKMLLGKDPGQPPGFGGLVPFRSVGVEIGGFNCPPIGEQSVGLLLKGLSKAKGAIRNRSARRGNAKCAEGSHPVYLVTGENFDSFVDFVAGLFEWRRHYTSARCRAAGPLGNGWRHFYQRSLTVRLHRATFTDWDGDSIEFPRFERGTDTTRADGYVLCRLARGRYRLSYRDEPAMEFVGGEFDGALRLSRCFSAEREVRLHYDEQGRLAGALERRLDDEEQRFFAFQYNADGHITHLLELFDTEPGRWDAAASAAGMAQDGRQSVQRAVYEYADGVDLSRVQDALGGSWNYEYDCFHRLTKQTDPRGYSFSYRYDIHGRCIEATGQDGLWRAQMEYLPEQRITRFTEGANATWEIRYDGEGFVTTIVDPYGGKKVRQRDGDGKILSEVDSGGRALRWLYDGDGAHDARLDDYGHLFPPEAEAPKPANPFDRDLPDTAPATSFRNACRHWPGSAVRNEPKVARPNPVRIPSAGSIVLPD